MGTISGAVDTRFTHRKPMQFMAVVLVVCSFAVGAVAFAAAQDERQYVDGPVTEMAYIHVEYGHFEEYIDWLNSTWKPTMEATKNAGVNTEKFWALSTFVSSF